MKSSYIGILYVNSGGGSYKFAKCKQLQATDNVNKPVTQLKFTCADYYSAGSWADVDLLREQTGFLKNLKYVRKVSQKRSRWLRPWNLFQGTGLIQQKRGVNIYTHFFYREHFFSEESEVFSMRFRLSVSGYVL